MVRRKTFLCDSSIPSDLLECMNFKKQKPLNAFKINDAYIIGVYEGKISEYDIIIRYRQRSKSTGAWSSIRTPKHIHWTVDILLKMLSNPELTKEFLDFLVERWEKVEPLRSQKERLLRTSYEYIAKTYERELNRYFELGKYGEYSIRFLIFLAELLMTQEKTNREDAYMFGKLLDAIKRGEEIYKIISIATLKGG